MIGQQLGTYTIDAELGAGGMGTVYRASGPDGPVALKVVHSHLLGTPGFFKRFMREAAVGKAVRHENVVRTLDVDALLVGDQQLNFIVMEYVEGRSLRQLLQDLGTVPETLLREIGQQAAAGLAAIHEAGIIHRDLKPENILITDDHEIRIMDLGVARLQEASIAITKEGQFAGSLLYAAPEQFKGKEVGAGADLYSLGVVLHELATGTNPFRADDPATVIQGHLNEAPPAASERNPDLSTFVSEVVGTLLAKAPADRFPSAQDLHDVLDQAEESAWWKERAPTLQRKAARLPRIRVPRDTDLEGRDRELDALNEAWKTAREGGGSTVLLEGEAGIGKTRLVDGFLRQLGEGEFHVLYGAYPPSGGLGGLADAISGKFGETGLAAGLGPYLAATPALVPAFTALVNRDALPAGAAPLQGDALQSVVTNLIRGLAQEKPTIWIVDDLQFAPPESRDLVLAMARAVEDQPALLLAATRPGVDLADFNRLGSVRRLELGRLSPRDVVRLLQRAFQSEMLADKLGVKIAAKSDGVPFFIFEMIRGLKEGRLIRQSDDGSYFQTQVISEIEVPSAVKDLIEQRMRALTAEHRAILDVGAVQGAEFDPDLVARVRETKRVKVLETLADIERRAGIVRATGRVYRFDQNQVHEVVRSGLSEPLREEYHTLLAEAFAERGKIAADADVPGEAAAFLAHHHLHGTEPAAGVPFLARAIGHLNACHRVTAARELIDRALTEPGLLTGAARGEMLVRKARQLRGSGDTEEERAALDEACALADEAGDLALRAKTGQALGWHIYARGRYDEAEPCMREALEIARRANAHFEEMVILGDLGGLCERSGRYAEALDFHERSMALSEEHEFGKGYLRGLGNKAVVLVQVGRYEEARALLAERLERHVARGDTAGYNRAWTEGCLASALHALGRFEEALEHQERALVLYREIGDDSSRLFSVQGVGCLQRDLGRYAEARRALELSVAIARETGHRDGESRSLVFLGALATACGDRERAAASFAEAQAILEGTPIEPVEASLLAAQGEAAEANDAEGFLERALALHRKLQRTGAVAETLLALARLRIRQERPDDAAGLLAEARTTLGELEDPATLARLAAYEAQLGRRDAADARAVVDGSRLGMAAEMECRFALHRAGADGDDLRRAHDLLLSLRDEAPANCRESILANVPLHRDILTAWEAR